MGGVYIKIADDLWIFSRSYIYSLLNLKMQFTLKTVTCRYLGKDLSTDEIKKVVEHTTFKAMEKNLKSNLLEIPVKSNYFRKGCIGDHKNVFNTEQLQYINNRLEKEFKHTGLYSANL